MKKIIYTAIISITVLFAVTSFSSNNKNKVELSISSTDAIKLHPISELPDITRIEGVGINGEYAYKRCWGTRAARPLRFIPT